MVARHVDGVDVVGVEVRHEVASDRIIEVVILLRASELDRRQVLAVVVGARLVGHRDGSAFRGRGFVAVDPPVGAAGHLDEVAPELAVAALPVAASLTVNPVLHVPLPSEDQI